MFHYERATAVIVSPPEADGDLVSTGGNPLGYRVALLIAMTPAAIGGTRSTQGNETKMTLASIFSTWRAQDLNTLATCKQLLASPQI
jgi:hypothetical protein